MAKLRVGAESSEFQKIIVPTAWVGLGLVVVGVFAPVIPFLAAAGFAATAISTGTTLLGTAGAGYVGQRTLLKTVSMITDKSAAAEKTEE